MTDVYVRKKPLLEDDKEIVKCINNKIISISKKYKAYDGRDKNKILNYNFNGIFDDNINNTYIYENVIDDKISKNMSCFMYGQTGSGKTHTVIGNPNDEGIFILTGKKLLNYADELYLSAYQIYNDTLYDLLNKNKKLKLLEDRNNTFQIPNMEIIKINNINDLNNMVLQLKNNRNESANNINMNSSRSHAVFLYNYVKDNNNIRIRIIDLAGNERSKNSRINNMKSRQENKHINYSLFSLKECIRNIDKGMRHIPFRRSKLTSVLRDCFTCTHKSIMIATVCSNKKNYSDIINTLNYSYKVNKCLNKPEKIENYINNKILRNNKLNLNLIKNSKLRSNLPKLSKINNRINLRGKLSELLSLDNENVINIPDFTNMKHNMRYNSKKLCTPRHNCDNELLQIIINYNNFLKTQQININKTILLTDEYIDSFNTDTANDFLTLLYDRAEKNLENMLDHMKIMKKIRNNVIKK